MTWLYDWVYAMKLYLESVWLAVKFLDACKLVILLKATSLLFDVIQVESHLKTAVVSRMTNVTEKCYCWFLIDRLKGLFVYLNLFTNYIILAKIWSVAWIRFKYSCPSLAFENVAVAYSWKLAKLYSPWQEVCWSGFDCWWIIGAS